MQPTMLDPDLHDPQARQLRMDRAAGNAFSTLEAVRATHGAWDHRWFLVSRIDGTEPRAAFDALVAHHPSDPCAYLLRGVHALAWGWLARGTGWASSVTEEGWRLLRERLRLADADLRYAASLDPADPTPWSFLIRVGLGLSWDKAAVRAVFEETRRRDPEHYPAHRQMLWAVSPKWGGTDADMFDFARSIAQAVPFGSDLKLLPMLAHFERFDAIDREQGFPQAKAYGAQAAAEVIHAQMAGPLAPQHRPRAWTHLARQKLLEWFYMNADRQRTRDELNALGHRIDPVMWGKDPDDYARKMRDWAFRDTRPRASGASNNKVALFAIVFLVGLSCFAFVAASAYQFFVPRLDDTVWIHNSTTDPIQVSVDGATSVVVEPRRASRMALDPGEHRVAVSDAGGAPIDQGTFTMPERTVLGLFGHRGLYDAGGHGRYVTAHVTYDGREAVVRDIGAGQRFFLFPAGDYTFRTRFAEEARRGTELDGVCARADDGSIPCLR